MKENTASESKYAEYNVRVDPLPLERLSDRDKRSLERSGVDFRGWRGFQLQANLDIFHSPEKKKRSSNRRKILVKQSPKRLLTHELLVAEERRKFDEENEKQERRQMAREDALAKRMAREERRLVGLRLRKASRRRVSPSCKDVEDSDKKKRKKDEGEAEDKGTGWSSVLPTILVVDVITTWLGTLTLAVFLL